MDILVDRQSESVVFTFPDRSSVEISVVEMTGEDVQVINCVKEAFAVLRDELHYFVWSNNSIEQCVPHENSA